MGDIEKAAIPVVALLLSMACPEVPSVVWSLLLTAILSGDITPEHIEAFLKQHNIKTYSSDGDFPNEVKSG